ncbi:MAG: hypothetical protein NTY77_09355 [Elusimicrobia bacterium]|nr:hypothetical protein [Elusimicrobiota bacterium]
MSLRDLPRRSLAVGLCLCLLTPPPGWAPLLRAADPPPAGPTKVSVTPKQVLDYLEKRHAFDGDNQKLRDFVGTDGFITPFGAVLYKYLKSRPDSAADEEVQGMQDSFKALTKNGTYKEKEDAYQKAFQTALQRYNEKFGDLPAVPGGSAEDTFALGTLREAMMTGAAVVGAPKVEYTQVDLGPEQGWAFRDKDGVAFVLNKNKVTIYNRELQKMQREINKTRPQQAAFVPETGRYNYEMFGVSYWRLKLQADQLDLATRLDRMVLMAELLGEQKKDQVFFDRNDPGKVNAAFEAELIQKAKAKTYSHKGKTYSLWDIAEAKTRVRDGYLKKAGEGIAYFQGEMGKFKDATSITDSQVKSMEMGEQFVMRYLSLAFLEAQKYAVRSQLERLDPASPDSKMVEAGLETMPLDAAAKGRYKGEGDKLRARLERLLAVLGRVEDVLCKTDYASNLDLAQAALNSSQKEIGEIGSNYELFTAAPGMTLALQQQSGSWAPQLNGSINPIDFNGSIKPWNWSSRWSWGFWHKAAATVAGGTSYGKSSADVNHALPEYQKIAGMISNGKYWDARAAIIKLNPDAVYEHPTMSLNGETPKVNDAARLAAALKATRDNITKIAAINRWVDTAGSLITWSVTIGLGAPLLRKGLAIVENVALKLDLKLIAAVAEQARLRLASLEASRETMKPGNMKGGGMQALREYLVQSTNRSISFAGRQVVFSLMSGTLSGAMTALGDLTGRAPFKLNLGIVKFGEGDSNFSNPADAFAQGFSGGVYWANDSFHPMLGYIGLPSSYFEGGSLAGITQTLGERGAIGSLQQGAKWVVGQAAERSSLVANVTEHIGGAYSSVIQGIGAKFGGSALASGVGKVMQFAWGTADSLAKYMVFSEGVGWAAKKVSWYANFNEADVVRPGASQDELAQLQDMPLEVMAGLERRIKRSEKTGAAWSESPLWLLIPTYPAKYEVAAQSFQRSAQGEDEYIKAGKDAQLANAEADLSYLPMLGKNKPPLMQRVFNFTYHGSKDADANFLVTKDIKRRAIARELKKFVSGGNAEADLGTINPEAFLKISRSDPAERKMIGELFNTDDVRIEARKQCVLALVKNPTLAEQILGAKPGSNVEGFGRVNPGVQREVAAMMLEELPAGIAVSPKIQGLAQGYIQRYLDSNSLGKAGGPAERLLKTSAANVHETKAQAEALGGFIKELKDNVSQWGQDVELQVTKKSYMDVTRDLSQKVEAKFKAGALTQEQFDALSSMFKLIEAQEGRFQSFNNVETTHALVNEELSALRVQYEGSPGVQKLLDTFGGKLAKWRDAVPDAARKTTVADAAPFKTMLGEFNTGIKEALSSRAISPEDAAALRTAVNSDMKGAPYILHDSKNTALSGWRPGQFVTYFESLTKVVEMGKGGAPVRGFMRLTTGGGKTLLAFEGLMPIAEADARMHNMEVGFFTVQSNLDAQAQLEWRSLRKVGSKLEFDTYEGLKSKIAEAKNKGGTYVEKVWILGDEMDGAALQPALTLGETTGKITRKNSVYTRMEELNTRMEQLLQRDAAELSEKVKVQARQAQSVIDGLDVRTPESRAARAATEKLLKAAEQLSSADSPAGRIKAEEAIRTHLSALNAAMSAPGLATFPEALSRLFAKSQEVQTAVDAARAQATPENLAVVRELLVEQQKLLGSKDLAASEQAKVLRRSTGELLNTLANPPQDADLGALLKEAVEAQQNVLHSTARIPDATKGSVQAAAAKISSLLDQGVVMDAVARKAMNQEVSDNLTRQENLLPLVGGDAQARVESLRLEATGLREKAEARIETLKRQIAGLDERLAKTTGEKGDLLAQKGALQSEMRLAQGEVALAQRFAGDQFGHAQRLVEKVFELQEQFPSQQAKSEQAAGAPKTLDGYVKRVTELGTLLERAADLRQRMAAEANPETSASLRQSLEGVQGQIDLVSGKVSRSLQSEKEFASLRKGGSGAAPEVAKLFELGQRMTALTERMGETAKSGAVPGSLTTELQALKAETQGINAGLGQRRGDARLSGAQTDLAALRQSFSPEQNAVLDAYQADVSKLYEVGRRMAAVDDQILDATKAGRPIEPFQKELGTLQAEADGVQAVLARSRETAQTRITAADLRVAEARFSDNSKQILDLINKGDAESQAAALRLLQGRKALLDAYAGAENPLYGIYKKMKADAFAVARSPIWERDEGEVAKKAVEKSKALMTGGAEELSAGLKSVEGLAKPGESEAALKLRQQAEAILRTQSEKWQELSSLPPGDREATLKSLGEAMDMAGLHATERERFLKALRAAQPGLETSFVERLESVFQGAEAREAALKTGVDVQLRSMQMTQDRAIKLYDERITGLTRDYSKQMMKEILADPLMPAGQRDKLFADALTSYLFPNKQYQVEWSVWPPWKPKLSIQPKGSWVREEFMNLVRGYYDDIATVRMDNLTHKTNVIHNGQWFETMDNPTRRFWELEYGTDITLPYTHKALSTIKDVTSNKKTRMFALSATAGEKYIKHLGESGISIGGSGAKKPANQSVDVREGEGGKYTGVAEAMLKGQQRSRQLVAVRPGEVLAPEANAPPEVRTYLEAQGLAKKDAMVIDLEKLPDGPVYDYFAMLRGRQGVTMEGGRFVSIKTPDVLARAPEPVKAFLESQGLSGQKESVIDIRSISDIGVRDYLAGVSRPQGSTALVVISLPDTRALKTVRKYLIKSGLASESEIAQVFSDAEYLRLNRPQANVAEQMNLSGMKSGKVKVLLLDTRVGGRGLDLDYKGDKGDPRLDAFKGYTNYEMLVMDPNKMSAVHLLQAEGRIDVGRVLLGAQRNFRLMMDIKTLQKDATFEDMYRNNDVFVNLRNDPSVHEFAQAQSVKLGHSVEVDWALIDSYVKQMERTRFETLKSDPQVIEFAAKSSKPVSLDLIHDFMTWRLDEARKSGDTGGVDWVAKNNLVERYNQVINENLDRKQQLIEEDQLRQSSVLQDKPISDPKLRWLDQLQRGR